MRRHNLSRRHFLRGAGVALALPFFESLLPRMLRAQALQDAVPRRYISLYFPNGTADFWRPRGEGSDWQLSPILEPLADVKAHLSVLSQIDNSAPFGRDDIEPSHSHMCAAAWTSVMAGGDGNTQSGVSVDQVIAQTHGAKTPLDSLQLGLTTLESYEDGLPGQHSRSISWRSANEPLYKLVNPQAVFDRMTLGQVPSSADAGDLAAAQQRRERQQSVLDFVLQDAQRIHRQLGQEDKQRLDQFLTSVRGLEQRVGQAAMQVSAATSCPTLDRPNASLGVGQVPADYSRDAHAELMFDLLVHALRCDITRVCSFMLDDARSDFVYDFLQERVFTDEGSTPGNGRVAGYHGLQHAGDRNNGYATIGHWNAQQAARLAQRLRDVDVGDGSTLLDHSVITFASSMHGGNHRASDLPVVLLGGGGRTAGGTVLKQNYHHVFQNRCELADVHLTLLREVYDCPVDAFGAGQSTVPELLA